MRVLVVEDERKVAKALRDGLEAERYDVSVAASGEEGFFLVNHEIFDLVLLDLMLPRRNGIEVLTTLRKRGLQTPVLILTAKDAVEDRVHGLDSGADDYLVKPFAILWHRLCGIGSWGAPWGAVSENGRFCQGTGIASDMRAQVLKGPRCLLGCAPFVRELLTADPNVTQGAWSAL